jgi:aquaporin Z
VTLLETPSEKGAARPRSRPGDGRASIAARALLEHWPEYLIEAWALATFMVSAGIFATLLGAPGSPVHRALPSPFVRMALMGVAMGATAMLLVTSPWGKRSGAHMNPAVTLTFLRLRKVAAWDASFYMAAQFLGGIAGVLAVSVALGRAFTDEPVQFAVTVPGPAGAVPAFAAELLISFVLMCSVLWTSNHPRLARFTPRFNAALVALYITFESPVSGMSMNPARTVASGLPAGVWTSSWVYLTAPVLAMLLASELYLRRMGAHRVYCAKLDHRGDQRCIFRCRYHEVAAHSGVVDAAESGRARASA